MGTPLAWRNPNSRSSGMATISSIDTSLEREASSERVRDCVPVAWMLPLDVEKLQHPSAPSDKQRGTRKYLLVKGILVDLARDRTDDLFHRWGGSVLMDSSTAPIPINYLQMVFSNWEIIGTFMHS
jgi:hypothetical protein